MRLRSTVQVMVALSISATLGDLRVAAADNPRAAAAVARSCYRSGTVEQARVCMESIKNASPASNLYGGDRRRGCGRL